MLQQCSVSQQSAAASWAAHDRSNAKTSLLFSVHCKSSNCVHSPLSHLQTSSTTALTIHYIHQHAFTVCAKWNNCKTWLTWRLICWFFILAGTTNCRFAICLANLCFLAFARRCRDTCMRTSALLCNWLNLNSIQNLLTPTVQLPPLLISNNNSTDNF